MFALSRLASACLLLRACFSSVDAKEVRFFNEINDWWDPNGSMRALHAYNALRLAYLKRIIVRDQELFQLDTFSKMRAVDVGSGGGLFAESMGKLGCSILGIDATENAAASPATDNAPCVTAISNSPSWTIPFPAAAIAANTVVQIITSRIPNCKASEKVSPR